MKWLLARAPWAVWVIHAALMAIGLMLLGRQFWVRLELPSPADDQRDPSMRPAHQPRPPNP